MNERIAVADQPQRDRALSPTDSFIVQAPAGSGKTGLLIQRYLALLAIVDRPEEILAITFTRKAAGEMRERVLAAFQLARVDEPTDAHARRTWRLAQAALQRDASQGWELEAHPGRLRIQTIDSFCAELTRQLPLVAGFGAPPAIVEQAQDLYREAARATLALLDEGGTWGLAVAQLARHLDNDFPYLESLLIDMLARRDHWLRLVADRSSAALRREALEAALGRIVEQHLVALVDCLSMERIETLRELLRYACEQLLATERQSTILAWNDLPAWPLPQAEQLPLWQGLAEFLLTKDGKWRAQGNEAIGFPAPSNAKGEERARREHFKTRFKALLDELKHDGMLAERLHRVRDLPSTRYETSQWQALDALLTLLPVAVAQLEVAFQEHGGIDFAQLAMAATRALGEPEAPTDLALALDYRIRHILVDEFQDTSLRQYELLARLTTGWETGDGRTLFVVGDPMQSIYRFREAEVGLFLQARKTGLAGVPLESLTLSVNFRSRASIVEWVNQAFPQIFPEQEDALLGGVTYSSSQAYRTFRDGEAVTLHPQFHHAPAAEAAHIVELVAAARQERSEASIAILVRSRTHLAAILPALREAGLRYQAVEIERLGERPVVRDLLTLTRAMIHPADRIAWLALLRAPWCGLSLSDLDNVVGDQAHALVWERINDDDVLSTLSEDGCARLVRLCRVLSPALAIRRRVPLRRWVEGTWLALGGPATLEAEADLADAEAYLDLLEALEAGADLDSLSVLVERVQQLFAAPDSAADGSLQVMTIHKAKGLEFDIVIIPGLGRRPNAGVEPLMRWLELAHPTESALVLAPIRARGNEIDAISRTLKRLDVERGRHEDARLLYVAATRARERLHLLGHCAVKTKGDEPELGRPAAGSLLEQLWPVVGEVFETRVAALSDQESPLETPIARIPSLPLRRLATDWSAPPPPSSVVVSVPSMPAKGEEGEVEFEWAGDTARCVGIVVHAFLQRIGRDGLAVWSSERVKELTPVFARELARHGVARDEREQATKQVRDALLRCLDDRQGRWILDTAHSEAKVEWSLGGIDRGQVVHVVLDRSFVDTNGTRWIIDYKTGIHLGRDREQFLDSEQARYSPQLERYARLLALNESRPIRLALYFPLLGGWREWAYEPGPQASSCEEQDQPHDNRRRH